MTRKVAQIAIGILIIGIIGCAVTFTSLEKPEELSLEKLVEDTNVTEIDVKADNQKIEVLPNDDNQIKVTLTGKGYKGTKLKVHVEEDNKLVVRLKEKHHIVNFNFFTRSLTLKVYLPARQYKSLKAHVDNGAIVSRDLQIQTIQMAADNGTIRLENMSADTTDVKTDNGKINMKYVAGKLTGKTNNGTISLVTDNLDVPIHFSTDNGKIKIKSANEPKNAAFLIHVDNGKVNLFDKYSRDAVFGNGDNLIKLTADNGIITVTK